MLRLAETKDLDAIMEIMQGTLEELYSYGNNQWDEAYPSKRHFENDIAENALYAFVEEDRVKAMVCVNQEEPIEYEKIDWRRKDKALVVHRFAVGVPYRKQRIATQIMEFIDAYARRKGFYYIKADTYSINEKMQYLLQKQGYCKRGTTQFRNKEKVFYCYDKILSEEETRQSG